jgi:hypothetical protein
MRLSATEFYFTICADFVFLGAFIRRRRPEAYRRLAGGADALSTSTSLNRMPTSSSEKALVIRFSWIRGLLRARCWRGARLAAEGLATIALRCVNDLGRFFAG